MKAQTQMCMYKFISKMHEREEDLRILLGEMEWHFRTVVNFFLNCLELLLMEMSDTKRGETI